MRAVAGENLVPSVPLEYNLVIAAKLFAKQIQRYVGRVSERRVVVAYQPLDHRGGVPAGDVQFVVVGPKVLCHEARLRELVERPRPLEVEPRRIGSESARIVSARKGGNGGRVDPSA